MNACEVNNGGCCKNAVCINTQHSYYCKCKSGYIGDGVTCIRQKQRSEVMYRFNLRELRAGENTGHHCRLLLGYKSSETGGFKPRLKICRWRDSEYWVSWSEFPTATVVKVGRIAAELRFWPQKLSGTRRVARILHWEGAHKLRECTFFSNKSTTFLVVALKTSKLELSGILQTLTESSKSYVATKTVFSVKIDDWRHAPSPSPSYALFWTVPFLSVPFYLVIICNKML